MSSLSVEVFGDQYQMPSGIDHLSTEGISALKALRDTCPNLEWMPLVSMCLHGEVASFYTDFDTGEGLKTKPSVVKAFFDFLRESWPSLEARDRRE